MLVGPLGCCLVRWVEFGEFVGVVYSIAEFWRGNLLLVSGH